MSRVGVGTTTFRIVRHGAHAAGEGVLVGRLPGVGLSDAGRRQIEALAAAAWVESLDLIHVSPRQRTMETASILAGTAGIEPVAAQALDEVDFGRWSGQRLADLEDDRVWRQWNGRRQHATTPGGETYRDVQWRAWRHLCTLCRRHPGCSIAVVTHAEIVRVLLLAARGLPLSDWPRIEVPLASVHVLRLTAASGAGVVPRWSAAP